MDSCVYKGITNQWEETGPFNNVIEAIDSPFEEKIIMSLHTIL